MNEETKNSAIEPELEARIVALVLGESSDFETEELNRLISLRPELAAFQQEMQQVHELMTSAAQLSRRALAAGVDTTNIVATLKASALRLMETPDANWKLSADRRQSVLAVIRGEANVGHASAPVAEGPALTLSAEQCELSGDETHIARTDRTARTVPLQNENRSDDQTPSSPEASSLTRRIRVLLSDSLNPVASSVRRRMRKTPMKIAAGICVAGFIGLITVPSFFREESRLADYSNHWSFSEDSVASAERFTGRYLNSGGTELGFQSAPQASSGPEMAEGETKELLLTQFDSANAASAVASSKALSTLQQTLNGGGLAANETDAADSTRWRAVAPPSSAPEAWFGRPLEGRFGDEGPSSMLGVDKSASLAVPEDVASSKPSAEWDRNSLRGAEYENGLGSGVSANQPEVMFRAPLLAGSIDRPASPEPVAAGKAVDESMPKLMIKSEEESLGKSLSLAVTDSEKTLEDMQASSGEQPLAGDRNSGGYAGNDKSGDAVDGRSDGEHLGGGMKEGEALGLSDDAPDFGTMGRGLSELSDDSDVTRRQVVPGQPGSGGPLDSVRGRRERQSGNTYRSSSEMSESKEEISSFELAAPDSVAEADSKKPGENAKQVEEQDWAKNLAEGKSPDFYMGHRFEMDLLDGLLPLAESKSKEAAQLESDSDDNGLKDPTALIKKNSEIPTDDEFWRRRSQAEWESDADSDGRRDGVWADKEMARSAIGLGTAGEKNPLLTDADKPKVLKRDQELAQTNPKTAAPSAGLNETNAAAEAFSTFSLHVSDVSFKLAASALARGEWPEAAKVRIEEFVNAFDYGDPLPGKGEKVACVVEQGIHPFLQQRNVLRVSMRTSAEGRATNTPLRLTFVLDNSGSMERIDRQQTVRRAFTLLSKQLTAIDQVTLISFSRQPRLLAENVSGTDSGKLVELMEQLPSEGGTNIEAALQLAFEKASAQQTPGAQNRIVLLTDGAVNLGNANPESLSQMVESMRAAGIAFDAAGISADGLNDEVLEALTRKGDGRYYLMDSGETADDNFAQQIAGALRPSASNVKVQVEFNPKRVGQYKLLGFEKHILKQEDFRNDAVDAAEMAAAEAGVAMYQFEAKPDGEGDVGSVSVRFRDLSTGEMVEHRWPIPYEPEAARPDQATPSLRIATTAAMLAAKLKGEALGESVDLQTLSKLIDSLPSQNQSQMRVQQLKLMIEQARQMSQK